MSIDLSKREINNLIQKMSKEVSFLPKGTTFELHQLLIFKQLPLIHERLSRAFKADVLAEKMPHISYAGKNDNQTDLYKVA
ncbi:hypothetical protein [Vagococcus acidifermentans]|uniref:Uncharacterized protein n=1 Tax=Vagococcus acidifermentans TaxID=564710 RepID=A0A430AR85_9ENTE|nr:hypothetical protein [Vagococcus acidifermentans]RSU10467.1 hypothetical protein CBF27_10680 [Vagococcus acidifermentans]